MPESAFSHSPRLSRETRRLLIAAGLALVVLWQLARIRYTDGAPAASPVPLLSQLAPPATFSDLAAEIGLLGARLNSAIVLVATGDTGTATTHAAIRISRTQAVAWLPDAAIVAQPDARVIARDGASGLTLLSVPDGDTVSLVSPSVVGDDEPRYVASTAVWRERLLLQPTFVAGLAATADPAWTAPILKAPPDFAPRAGAFIFTMRGDLLGLVVPMDDALAIVPSNVLGADVERLRESSAAGGGELGFEVQTLTPAVAATLGASAGVIVTHVDPEGPAATVLAIGDVIEAADGQALDDAREWRVYSARIAAGSRVSLQVRRRDRVETMTISASRPVAVPATDALGLTMRVAPGVGIRIAAVERGSAADRAGLAAGDVITLVSSMSRPTPTQLRRAFAALQPGGAVMVAVTRESRHHIFALAR